MEPIYRGSISDIMYQLEKDGFVLLLEVNIGYDFKSEEDVIPLIRYNNLQTPYSNVTRRRQKMLKDLVLLKAKGNSGTVTGFYISSFTTTTVVTDEGSYPLEEVKVDSKKLYIEFE